MTDQPTPVHGYFADKARDVFTAAGGDPDRSGALAVWAEAAHALGYSRQGVLVGVDGTILAETRHTRPGAGAGAAYVTDCPTHPELVGLVMDMARASLRRVTGGDVIHIKYGDVCQGAGRRA